MASIDLQNVRKVYPGGAEAVKGVDLTIADGEFIVLVGPSGCGKSTLLRMIAGLERTSAGTIRIGERVVNDIEPANRDIAMVFQNYALYPHMSVRQNMAYGLKNRGTARDEIARRVGEAANILQLHDYLDRKPRQLSGGQRQRVAMGRAIVREPAVFLFDEPLSNLDAKLRVEMRGEIKQLQRRLGTTSIYVTHDQLEAMTLADRLVVVNGGRIEQIGIPLEVYRNPASAFVASFIGSPAMNLLEGEIEGSSLRLGSNLIALNGSIAHTGPVHVGLRAEEIAIPRDPGEANLRIAIAYVEELGAGRLVHGELDGQKLVIHIDSRVELGVELLARVEPEKLCFFSPSTGKRLGAGT